MKHRILYFLASVLIWLIATLVTATQCYFLATIITAWIFSIVYAVLNLLNRVPACLVQHFALIFLVGSLPVTLIFYISILAETYRKKKKQDEDKKNKEE